MTVCPSCGSEDTRRGGTSIWIIYVSLIVFAIPAVLMFKLNAALVAAIMVVIAALSHLVLEQRVCVACGHQWRRP